MSLLKLALTVVVALSPVSLAVADQPFFMGLGGTGTGAFKSQATGISADGSTVVGRGGGGWRWTLDDGMVPLGNLPGSPSSMYPRAVSGDGSRIAGDGPNQDGDNEAFLWENDQFVALGDLAGGDFLSVSGGISGDGSKVVGAGMSSPGLEAFIWTQAGGIMGLGDLSGGSFASQAYGISSDGAVVVGYGTSGLGIEAFRWTAGGGMSGIGDLPGGGFLSRARAVSVDGSVVVGQSRSTDGLDGEAFRWTVGQGMIGLGDLPGGDFWSLATAVSGDGSVVVGTSISETFVDPEFGDVSHAYDAFIWDAQNGMRNLRQVLVNDFGLDLTGWEPELGGTGFGVIGISADGLTLVGTGRNPAGETEAWVAHIPEPASGLLAVVAGMLVIANGNSRARRDR